MGTSDLAFPAGRNGVHCAFRNYRPCSRDDIGRRNQHVFQRRGVLRQYYSAAGWLDAGEQAAVALVAGPVAGRAILDIGVGGGRTAPLLRRISDDYHGIDYAPAMVAMARCKFPDCAFTVMDARQMDFPDASFAPAEGARQRLPRSTTIEEQ